MSDICLANTIKYSSVFLQAATGVVLTVFKPQVPAIVPTAEGLLKSLVDTQSDVGFCVPLFIEVSMLKLGSTLGSCSITTRRCGLVILLKSKL